MYGLTSLQLVLLALAGLVGGLVRGYSGFGFALAAVPLLNLGFAPAVAVPSVLIVECAIGLSTVFREQIHINWQVLRWLMAGTLIGTPLGVVFLSHAPTEMIRLIVALAVLGAAGILWRRPHLPWLGGGPAQLLGGFTSGLLNGAVAMSGPPAILALLGAPLSDRAARAVLMAFILFSAALGVGVTCVSGLQSHATVLYAAVMAPAVVAGAGLGGHLFTRLPERYYRMGSLTLLVVISVITVTSTLWALRHPATV